MFCFDIRTRSETFPLDQYTTELQTDDKKNKGVQLDEEFFRID